MSRVSASRQQKASTMSKFEPLPVVAGWTDHYNRQPYFPSEAVYDQFGYLWARHLMSANYTLASAIRELKALDVKVSGMARQRVAHWDPDKDSILRVCVDPLTQRVEVTHFGMECVDLPEVGTYANTSELPMWVQERVAVLSMMPSKPPTEAVDGVGQRINAVTYWVTKP